MTKETVRKELRELMEGPVTMESSITAACLMYIDERFSRHCTVDSAMTAEEVRHWVDGMENTDGTMGPHWSMEETWRLQTENNLQSCGRLAFWAAVNMIWSDYGEIILDTGCSVETVCPLMAAAFLMDPDSKRKGLDKLAAYYRHVVS